MCSAATRAPRAFCWSARTAKPSRMAAGSTARSGSSTALEAARALAADPSLAGVGVEAVAWADEEGHYGNMLGSRSFTGTLSDDEIARATSRDGKKLSDALAEAGYAGRPRSALRTRSAISAISRRISSRAARSRRPGSVSASSRRSSATGITGSPSPASRTMPARPRCIAARMPPPRWCGSPRASTTASPKSPGPAHGVDDRAHPDRPERAEHRPRPRRDAGAVPRHRHRHPGARSSRRCTSWSPRPTAPDRARSRSRRSRKASRPDGSGVSARDREGGRASRAGSAHADAERRRSRRADPGPPHALRRCCSSRASRASAITGPRTRARRTSCSARRFSPTPPPQSCKAG